MEICKENKSHTQINQTQRLYKLLYKKDPLLHFQFNFSSALTSILVDFSDLWSSNLIAFHRASFCLSPHTLFVYLISRPFNTITLLGATSRDFPFHFLGGGGRNFSYCYTQISAVSSCPALSCPWPGKANGCCSVTHTDHHCLAGSHLSSVFCLL